MRVERVSDEPILRPRASVHWESGAVFNTAAAYEDGVFHLFYRAVEHLPGKPNRSCIGHAWSGDGIHFECAAEPALAYGPPEAVGNPHETQGVEDPRVTKLGDAFYMLYTAYDGTAAQVAYATSTDLEHWDRQGLIILSLCIGISLEDHFKGLPCFFYITFAFLQGCIQKFFCCQVLFSLLVQERCSVCLLGQ